MKKTIIILLMAILLISFASASEWEWVQIGSLKEGDSLMDKDRNEIEITSIEKAYDEKGVMVYDLEIKDYHYYFADNVLVHNSEANQPNSFTSPGGTVTYTETEAGSGIYGNTVDDEIFDSWGRQRNPASLTDATQSPYLDSNNQPVDDPDKADMSSNYDRFPDYQTQPACFLPTTPITLSDGTKKQIQNIEVGDKVLSYDLKNKKPVVSEVLNTYSHLENEYLIISLNPKDSKGLEMSEMQSISEHSQKSSIFDDSKNFQSNNKIKVTPYHNMHINNGWKQIGNAKVGDKLMDKDGNEIPIESIETVYAQEGVMVYDLEIKDYHYYFAEDVLVHNSGYETGIYNGEKVWLRDGHSGVGWYDTESEGGGMVLGEGSEYVTIYDDTTIVYTDPDGTQYTELGLRLATDEYGSDAVDLNTLLEVTFYADHYDDTTIVYTDLDGNEYTEADLRLETGEYGPDAVDLNTLLETTVMSEYDDTTIVYTDPEGGREYTEAELRLETGEYGKDPVDLTTLIEAVSGYDSTTIVFTDRDGKQYTELELRLATGEYDVDLDTLLEVMMDFEHDTTRIGSTNYFVDEDTGKVYDSTGNPIGTNYRQLGTEFSWELEEDDAQGNNFMISDGTTTIPYVGGHQDNNGNTYYYSQSGCGADGNSRCYYQRNTNGDYIDNSGNNYGSDINNVRSCMSGGSGSCTFKRDDIIYSCVGDTCSGTDSEGETRTTSRPSGSGGWAHYSSSIGMTLDEWASATSGYSGVSFFYDEPDPVIELDESMSNYLGGIDGWTSEICKDKVSDAFDSNSGIAFSSFASGGAYAHIQGEKIQLKHYNEPFDENEGPQITYLYKISFVVTAGSEERGCNIRFTATLDGTSLFAWSDGRDYVFNARKENGQNTISYADSTMLTPEYENNYNRLCIHFEDIDPEIITTATPQQRCLIGFESGDNLCATIRYGGAREMRTENPCDEIGLSFFMPACWGGGETLEQEWTQGTGTGGTQTSGTPAPGAGATGPILNPSIS